MKSTTILIAAILMATTVQAQSKNNWDTIISKAKKATDLHFSNAPNKDIVRVIGSDTAQIADQIKVVKIGDKAIPTELLKKAMLILSQEDVNNFVTGIQEYPAKIANPFTQYFIKFFNLQVQEPKKQ